MLLTGKAEAANVAVVKGSFYTPNLKNSLTSVGATVTEIASYTAASLTGFDAVVHYGNSFVDFAALESYVATSGGIVVETPHNLASRVPNDLVGRMTSSWHPSGGSGTSTHSAPWETYQP